jgi:UDP-2-acetamido-3-amino-2,3-dideoxy-glucuronate N-acetyltransferase
MSNQPPQRPSIAVTAIIQESVLIGASTFIGEFCFVRSGTEIGEGCVIGSFVGIEACVRIGNFTSIQSRCHLTSGVVIGENCFFGPGVITMNDRLMAHGRPSMPYELSAPVVEQGARIGGGVMLLPGAIIRENAFVYAGSVVSGTVEPGQIVTGNPARPIGIVPRSEWL